MKKIIFLFILMFSAILVGCQKPVDTESILKNPDYEYYVTSTNSNWTANKDNKLTATKLSDKILKDLSIDNKNVKYLYVGSVTLEENANYDVTHNGKKINGGLTFEIVKTNNPNKFKDYDKLTSRGDLYTSLTPDTLYSSDEKCTYNGCVAKKAGSYTVIFIENEDADGTYKYEIGLIKKVEKSDSESTPSVEKTPSNEETLIPDVTPTVPVEPTPTPTIPVEPTPTPEIDLSSVLLKNATFDYDGTVKSLALENLPKNVKVVYENNDQIEPGIYAVTAYIYNLNDELLETFEAILTIEEVVIEPTPTPDPNPTPTPTVGYDGEDILPGASSLASNVQDGLILHAWNWSYKNIEANLENIARSGYTTVQVSPVQQPKDYDPKYPKGWAEQWWKFYQPISYSIAQSSWLGTKADLTSLCSAADKYGIKIIADIVANHSANVSDEGTSNQSTPHKTLNDYESDLYLKRSSYFRTYITNNDSSIQAVVQGSIGMPDLRTETEYVQNMIIDLLKECIDCGIDGFRFDAAKHIETPDDGQYASNFWPNVLTQTTNYATSKNVTLYYYGEILNTCGNGRNFGSYTKYMSITDNVTGNNIRNAIESKNASSAASSSYKTGQPANKLVLWAESHDTYANDSRESTNVSQANINKTWALVAARKDATALYFARPGEVGSIGTYDWMSTEVSAVNNFHNKFIGASETLYSADKFAVVERYNSSSAGLVIVNCNGTTANASFKVKNIPDGDYIDQITGNKFVVKNQNIIGNIGATGIAVLVGGETENTPVATLSQAGGYFNNTLTLNIDLSFASSARVKVGNNEQIITDDTTITIGSNMNYGDKVVVEVAVINEKYRVTKTYEFIKLNGLTANSVVVSDVPTSYTTGGNYDVYAWVWESGKDGRFVKTTLNGSYLVFDVKSNETNFLLLTVSKGVSPAWNYKVKQTSDFMITPNGIYSAPKEVWS